MCENDKHISKFVKRKEEIDSNRVATLKKSYIKYKYSQYFNKRIK